MAATRIGQAHPPAGGPARATEILSRFETGSDGFSVQTPEDWVSTFGGVGAALCLAAAERYLGPLPPLRTAQFLFPTPLEGRLAVYPSILFAASPMTFAEVKLYGGARPSVLATLGFGATPAAAMTGPLPGVLTPPPVDEGFVQGPEGSLGLARHYEIRDHRRADAGLWLRHRDPYAGADAASLLMLAEVAAILTLPPAVDLDTAHPLAWSVDILRDHLDSVGGWWRADSAPARGAAGYLSHTVQLSNSDGQTVLEGRHSLAP